MSASKVSAEVHVLHYSLNVCRVNVLTTDWGSKLHTVTFTPVQWLVTDDRMHMHRYDKTQKLRPCCDLFDRKMKSS
jgi:hypothetical protein